MGGFHVAGERQADPFGALRFLRMKFPFAEGLRIAIAVGGAEAQTGGTAQPQR